MNVTNVTVTKVAEEKTANGLYVLEYSAVNGRLTRVQARNGKRIHPVISRLSELFIWSRKTCHAICLMTAIWLPISRTSTFS